MTTLRNTIQNFNFVDPNQTRKAHETIMLDVNREVRYIGTKYNVLIDPLYFQFEKFILTLENQLTRHFRRNIEL